jgi:hypothetical protein
MATAINEVINRVDKHRKIKRERKKYLLSLFIVRIP